MGCRLRPHRRPCHRGRSGKWRFNFLEWEASRPEEGGGLTINIVALLDEIAGAIANSAGKAEGGGGGNKFWEDALHHMNTNLVDLPIFAGIQVSLPLMRSIVNSRPKTLPDRGPQMAGKCLLRRSCGGDKATKSRRRSAGDFEECRDYWLQEYPVLSEKTRSIITLSFSMLVRPSSPGPQENLFHGHQHQAGGCV
jgi:hypothetical protein